MDRDAPDAEPRPTRLPPPTSPVDAPPEGGVVSEPDRLPPPFFPGGFAPLVDPASQPMSEAAPSDAAPDSVDAPVAERATEPLPEIEEEWTDRRPEPAEEAPEPTPPPLDAEWMETGPEATEEAPEPPRPEVEAEWMEAGPEAAEEAEEGPEPTLPTLEGEWMETGPKAAGEAEDAPEPTMAHETEPVRAPEPGPEAPPPVPDTGGRGTDEPPAAAEGGDADPDLAALVAQVGRLAEALRTKGEEGLAVTRGLSRFEVTLRSYCAGYLAGRRGEED